MKIAIMQPYLFPYLGYFQLINAVDVFVFYDDVNFINRGWVNRNKILVNGKENRFTVALSKASQNKKINEIELLNKSNSLSRLLKTLEYNYKNAPYFDEVYELINEINLKTFKSISDINIYSIKSIAKYLNMNILFEISSEKYVETKGMEKSERLIAIAKKRGCKYYINPKGGLELYDKQSFKREGINLQFMNNELLSYDQFEKKSVVGLSIIDVLMFNSKEETVKLIEEYKLI